MLGTVISADRDLIGQLQPHVPTKFVSVDMETATWGRRARTAAASPPTPPWTNTWVGAPPSGNWWIASSAITV